ncbi:MAG: RnfABCDGE type electron transport complex subunit G [Bacteroidota bacterium]|nr:RnfABCDGE type electron transport complex subunit G [Bacteroidota bacterium]
MAKIESTLRNMVISLIAVTALTGALLATVYEITKAPIAASENNRLIDAIRQVAPSFDNLPLNDSCKIAVGVGDTLKVYPTRMDGKFTGAAIESYTRKGFSGVIRIMVGFNADGAIRNYVVLHHAETPGLGAKMQQWFSDTTQAGRCIIGRNSSAPLRVKKDGGDIDAITAATISSRAFLDAINRAALAFQRIDKNPLHSK